VRTAIRENTLKILGETSVQGKRANKVEAAIFELQRPLCERTKKLRTCLDAGTMRKAKRSQTSALCFIFRLIHCWCRKRAIARFILSIFIASRICSSSPFSPAEHSCQQQLHDLNICFATAHAVPNFSCCCCSAGGLRGRRLPAA